jgi:hypothetical protein
MAAIRQSWRATRLDGVQGVAPNTVLVPCSLKPEWRPSSKMT